MSASHCREPKRYQLGDTNCHLNNDDSRSEIIDKGKAHRLRFVAPAREGPRGLPHNRSGGQSLDLRQAGQTSAYRASILRVSCPARSFHDRQRNFPGTARDGHILQCGPLKWLTCAVGGIAGCRSQMRCLAIPWDLQTQ